MAFSLSSPDLRDGDPLPATHARDGANLSPALAWTDPPRGTRSFALVVEDPDAPGGTFRHWGLHRLPGALRELPRGAGNTPARDDVVVAVNDFGHAAYDGPEPPVGHGPHRYRFRLMALDLESLGLGERPAVAEILSAARGHVLGEAVLEATYERRGSARPE